MMADSQRVILVQNVGVTLIQNERDRQIADEGYTPEHDDAHFSGDLALAGMSYAYQAVAQQGKWVNFPRCGTGNPPRDWPWISSEWKPADDPIRNLIKAGALIAAEIDRLERLKVKQGDTNT